MRSGPPTQASAPGGRLFVVATPIGNLGDLSPRAADVLRSAGRVCCEDTRRTRALLTAAKVPAGRRLVALHAHNESAVAPSVLRWLAEGLDVALVTDAGTPGLSDPGPRLVAAAIAAGVEVTAVPGSSAALAALMVSGWPADRCSLEGFVPRKGEERRRRLEAIAAETRPVVLFEAPGRLAATLADLAAADPDRPVLVARELTKLHEELWRGRLVEAAAEFAERPRRGECAVVLGPQTRRRPAPSDDQLDEAVARHLGRGATLSQAAQAVASELGVARQVAYQAGLRRRRAHGAVTDEGLRASGK